MSEEPIFCDRCLCELRAGRGQFYEVRIEAVADPTVTIDAEELDGDGSVSSAEKFSEIVREMGDLSAQEAMDQVWRRLRINLCTACYEVWIENPGGNRNE